MSAICGFEANAHRITKKDVFVNIHAIILIIMNPERPPDSPQPKPSRRKFLTTIGLAGVGAGLAGVGAYRLLTTAKPKKELLPPTESPFPPAGPYAGPNVEDKESADTIYFPKPLIEDVKKTYSERAVRYAMQIVENGQRIAHSPVKQAELLKLRAHVEAKYSSRIKIPVFFGYVNQPKETKQVAALFQYRDDVVQRSKDRGRDLTLPVSFIIAAASNEGQLLDVASSQKELEQWNQPVSGFWSLGLDCFASDYADIKHAGLLPPKFEEQYDPQLAMNDVGSIVNSANFRSKGVALNAFVAELAFRQMLCRKHLMQQGIQLAGLSKEDHDDVILFLTYIYYNAGPTIGRKIVQSFATAADALALFQLAQTNPKKIDLNSAPANAYVVMAGMEYLKLAGATDGMPDKENYWWLHEKKPKVVVE